MPLQIGIVGLPNVGKSTLFNALTQTKSAQAANYPFCTIDPNVGVVEVPDERLNKLTELVKPERVVPTIIEFVDIAGLVKGASGGEGLGNQFLSHIRQCDAIAQVIRIFDDENITHVHGNVDPLFDREVIELELILADLQTVEKRLTKAQGEAKTGAKGKKEYLELIERLYEHLKANQLANSLELNEEEQLALRDLHLLTMKPFIYVANVEEDKIAEISPDDVRKKLNVGPEVGVVVVSAKIESELMDLSAEEAEMFLADLGLKESGLNQLIRAAYKTLGLSTYFTAGVKEVRAWTIKEGYKAPQAAGVIHTDFEKGFIKADVIAYQDFVQFGGEAGAKEAGKLRMEGKEYLVKDGDVMHFKFNN